MKIGKKVIRVKRKNKKRSAEKTVSENISYERRKLELKKQRKIQKAKRKLIIFMFFLLALSVTVVIFKAPFFDIKGVVCIGYERLTEENILNNAKVVVGENIFTTNLGGIKERIAAIPYVSESNARRIFPDKIKIWVRECVPAFVVKNGNKYVLCDTDTKVLEIIEENSGNLAEITFPQIEEIKEGNTLLNTSDAKNQKIIECIKTIEKLEMLKLTTSIDFKDISDIIILYDKRLKIKIGDTSDISYKLNFIAEVINKNIADHERATIDYTGDKLYIGQFDEEKPEKTEESSEEETQKTEEKNEEMPKKEEKSAIEKMKGKNE